MKQLIATVSMTAQAEGAWPNGSAVVKANSQPDDGTPDGTHGEIIGSMDVHPLGRPARFIYFVKWPDVSVPVLCADTNNDGTPRLELEP